MPKFFLARDSYEHHSYELCQERPKLLARPNQKDRGRKLVTVVSDCKRMTISDRDAKWLFPGVSLKPGEIVEVSVGIASGEQDTEELGEL